MTDEEKLQKMLKSMQTSMHDQINAVKYDAQKAVSDSEAALELSATLVKIFRELESGKFKTVELMQSEAKVLELAQKNIEEIRFESRKAQLLTFMNQHCLHFSTVGAIKAILASAMNNLDKLIYYIEQLGNLNEFNNEFSEKIRKAKGVEQIKSLTPQLVEKYAEIQNAIFSQF